ncbi:tRNA (guanine(9)-N1)-methyltransferase [Talaromyces atroroseus]|uniref:tRNA (guanine(9)-N1)-methyltransferase n=1 Tax=Talaromyces atroroseus TaxID=1441469 RepID=A0A225A814_TALAT|nr:tRNA (guanine(9)-N1)-methyltransferase [Talaromyces atroroseus]OKL56702.1 tRNA (guanine(9)-N1)-methyltransferase [Talaromyces atroroseus]
MEEEERPRKLQKLGHGGELVDPQQDTPENNEPLMSGALNENSAVEAGQQPADGTINSALSIEASERQENANGQTEKEENGTTEVVRLSKRQQKKLKKVQQWEAQQDERRIKRRERKAQRRERIKEERRQNAEENKDNNVQKDQVQPQRRLLVPVTLVIDCGWDDLMKDGERKSLATQITRSYSDNTKAPFRSHLVISSFDKLLKERFDNVLQKAYESWKGVRFMQEDFVHVAEKAKTWMTGPRGGELAGVFEQKDDSLTADPENGEIIYLSSDSPNTLTELKPYSTYIIGGLVDKNRHKGVCYQKAIEMGVKTAKLPIGEYLRMASRPVLATNHVVEIMIKWLELGDWGEAFMKVIPPRKGGTLKTAKADEGHVEEEPEADTAALVVEDGDDSEVEPVAVAENQS